VNILSYSPGHDGAIAYLKDARLQFSIEAEKNSNYRYSPISSHDVFNVFGELDEIADVICTGSWWPREERALGSLAHVGYRGLTKSDIRVDKRRLLGRPVHHFSSSHERSHLLCAFGMSSLPKGTPCYALVWEGAIGAFYEIDSELNIALLADVLNEPGNRYTSIYGLADPTFPKNAPFSRFSDAGLLSAYVRQPNPVWNAQEPRESRSGGGPGAAQTDPKRQHPILATPCGWLRSRRPIISLKCVPTAGAKLGANESR
jgi:hypothetical protein